MTPLDTIPDDEYGDVLRRLVASGDDLTKSRDIDFSHVFLDETSAQRFADQARLLGFEPSVERAEVAEGMPWDVTATRHMKPDHGLITATELQLARIASEFGGRADGWGCFAVNALNSS